jgi:hypothetical protein
MSKKVNKTEEYVLALHNGEIFTAIGEKGIFKENENKPIKVNVYLQDKNTKRIKLKIHCVLIGVL